MPIKLSDFDENSLNKIEKPKEQVSATQFAKGVAVGGAKSVGETVLGVGELGRHIQRGISSVGERVFGSYNPFNMGGSSIFDPERAQQIRDTTLAANAPGEGTGKFLGTALQYLAPTSGITKMQQVLGKAATQLPRGLQLAGKTVARFLPEAIGTGTVSTIRSGGDLDESTKEAMLAGGFSVFLGALGRISRSTYWPGLEDSVTKALGIQGKKSGGVTLSQTAQKVSGLQVLKERANNLSVTLDDGTKATFDPTNASYSTTLQAWNQAKEQIYKEYSSLAREAGEKTTIDLSSVRKQIQDALDAPVLSVEKNAVKSILKDFDSIFNNPNAVEMEQAERFVKSLNENTVQGFFAGTSDAASSKVNAGTAKIIREILDDAIEDSTGQQYQALRSEYASLKSIEDDLVRKFQQDARSIGGGLPEYTGAFAGADIIGSALSLDPAQFAKGATLGTFSALKRKLSNPERFLRRSFDLIDEVPSDLKLRIWGGTRPLSSGEQQMADTVAESALSPSIGMSIRSSVTPEKVAKMIDQQDVRNIAKIIDNVDLRINYEEMLNEMGLSKATDNELVRFLKEVVDLAEGRGF